MFATDRRTLRSRPSSSRGTDQPASHADPVEQVHVQRDDRADRVEQRRSAGAARRRARGAAPPASCDARAPRPPSTKKAWMTNAAASECAAEIAVAAQAPDPPASGRGDSRAGGERPRVRQPDLLERADRHDPPDLDEEACGKPSVMPDVRRAARSSRSTTRWRRSRTGCCAARRTIRTPATCSAARRSPQTGAAGARWRSAAPRPARSPRSPRRCATRRARTPGRAGSPCGFIRMPGRARSPADSAAPR